MDAKTVLELARDIASGMSHLHAENVMHCDLGTVKVNILSDLSSLQKLVGYHTERQAHCENCRLWVKSCH